jgi:heme exporter protein A
MALLAAENVSKELDGRLVLRDASVQLHAGRCLALFGSNGSGKSTLLRILATLWRPTRGGVTWEGNPVTKARAAYRRQLGYVGHESQLYGELSARENLLFFGGLYGVSNVEARADELLDEVGLTRFADMPVRAYSRGMTQRATLARALIHSPRILLLDEPFTGLDATMRAAALKRLDTLRDSGAAMCLVTHDIESGYEAATDFAFVRRGRVESAEASSLAELRAVYANEDAA